MTTLSELFKVGYKVYKDINSRIQPTQLASLSQKFEGLEVQASSTVKYKAESYSNYFRPIDRSPERLAGLGRAWGQAVPETQYQVMDSILSHSQHLSVEDQAIILAIARVESGFNPDAAATSTSASGVFQLVKETANNLGIRQEDIFDAESNIVAGIKLYEENLEVANKRFPKLSGDERAVMLYALHHDGPSLNFGGDKIARQQIVPFLDEFRAVTYDKAFNEVY